MNPKYVFPTALIALDICAALAYWGDWRKMIYWFAAGLLTTVVTF
jgi:hypothetical protein